MTNGYRAVRITTNTTTNIAPASCFVTQIVITVESAGSSWKMRIQDKQATPFVLVPETTLSAPSTPTAVIIHFDEPIIMQSGIDVVTPSGTPGAVCIWFNGFITE